MHFCRSSSRPALAICALALAGCSKYVKDDKPYKIISSRPTYAFDADAPVVVVEEGVVIAVTCKREVVEMYCEKRHALTGTCAGDEKKSRSEAAKCKGEIPAASLAFEWAPEAAGIKRDDATILFPIEWKDARVNPLGDDATATVTKAGVVRIGGVESPISLGADAASGAIERIAKSVAIDMTTGSESRDVSLVVESLSVAEGELVAGEANVLLLTVRNQGPGVAYRVSASVRSGTPGLHNREAAVGMLQPSQSRTVKIPVRIAEESEDRSAMVVVKLTEHNHPNQRSHNQRLRIVANPNAGLIAAGLKCEIAAATGDTVVVAGKRIALTCVVSNKSDKRGLSDLELEASIGSSARKVSVPAAIEPGQQKTVTVEVVVPASTKGEVAVKVALAGGKVKPLSTVVKTQVVSGLCGGQKISMEEYRERRAKFEKAFQAGALSATEFDQYDAELVSCLK